MWKQFLNQARAERKFQNTPVIVLGNKHSGKRSLIDTLFDISKTTLHTKRLASHTQTSKMRLKDISPIIDYGYLNVLDPIQPDNRTHCKLQMYMIQDNKLDFSIFKQLTKSELLKKAIFVIMLDFTNPWNFMSELNDWIEFILLLETEAGFNSQQIEEMKNNFIQCYKNYKKPQFDQQGKLKKNMKVVKEEPKEIDQKTLDKIQADALLFPLIICVNKCDQQSLVLREESSLKLQIILYHLRKYCLTYGGTLIFTSIKNNSNLNTLYEYILHRAYKIPLRFKPQIANQQAIFIPLGFDNQEMLDKSIEQINLSEKYEQDIQIPFQKKVANEDEQVLQDSQYFKKYIPLVTASTTKQLPKASEHVQMQTSPSRPAQVTKFFQDLLRNKDHQERQTNRHNKFKSTISRKQ